MEELAALLESDEQAADEQPEQAADEEPADEQPKQAADEETADEDIVVEPAAMSADVSSLKDTVAMLRAQCAVQELQEVSWRSRLRAGWSRWRAAPSVSCAVLMNTGTQHWLRGAMQHWRQQANAHVFDRTSDTGVVQLMRLMHATVRWQRQVARQIQQAVGHSRAIQ